MQSMKGATMLLGSMNRQMNLPALQRIAMEFERENEVMDERQEMMDDAIDEATGMEGEEEEGEDIVKEVLDEIGVDLGQAVRPPRLPSRSAQWTDQSKNSWVRHHQRSRKRPRVQPLLRKRLVEEVMQMTMISKLGWIVFDDDDNSRLHTTHSSLLGSAGWNFGVSLLFHGYFSTLAYCSNFYAITV